MPQKAETNEEILSCYSVMAELRPHLEKSEFIALVRSMETEGFQLAFIKNDDVVVAAAGYRIYTNLFMGKHLYVDDLVTSSSFRSKGFGEDLIDWLRDLARSSDCKWFHLDSGTQRGSAHKFYFKQGFTIASYHFSEQL